MYDHSRLWQKVTGALHLIVDEMNSTFSSFLGERQGHWQAPHGIRTELEGLYKPLLTANLEQETSLVSNGFINCYCGTRNIIRATTASH